MQSGRRGSNSRQPAWKAGALPTELLPHCECKDNITFVSSKFIFEKIIVEFILQKCLTLIVLLLICYSFLCDSLFMKKIKEILASETFLVRLPILREGLPIESCAFEGDNLPTTKHFGLFIDENLTAIASVFKNNTSIFNDENQYQIRGMAVLNDFQKKGLGNELLRHCELYVKTQNGALIWFNARESAVPFYEKMNYLKIGNKFNIEGVGMHFIMKKEV